MADSLRLKGTKHVINQTGDEFKLRRPKRGGDVHMVPRWWAMKKTVNYINAAIFDVQTSGGPVAMIIPADAEATDISIIADGDGNFIFPIHRCVDRVALMAPDLSVFYEEYQFAKISGGPVLRRTVNALPQGVSFTGNTTIVGSPQVGVELTATPATFTGGVGSTSVAVRFQSRDAGSGNSWATIQTDTSSPYTLTPAAGLEGKELRAQTRVTDNTGVSVKNGNPTGTVAPAAATFAEQLAAAVATYTVTVVDDNGVNKYALNGVQQDTVTLTSNEIVAFDFTAALPNHPLALFTDSSKTTPVTVGVYSQGNVVLFQPPIAGTFSYQCINHAAMGGDITVN